jgi:TonB-dependent starch-binding outer membrane protein SusC
MMKKNRLIKVATLMLPMLLFSFWSFGQTLTIHGSVKDETGSPLPGVTVVVKGTSNGTSTDINGNYSISVPADAKILSFSFVGMVPLEIEIGGKTLIDAVLKQDVQKLEEIVVIGYGTQRRESVTGSVSSIKGDVMRDVPAGNITSALQGRIAGVDMQQTSSQPGASMQIRIRGTRSLNATNDPLVVLDGIPFPGSIGDINPNDIKDLVILKDASATAIYGSRGANGVILITTKKGEKGGKAQFSYNGYYGPKTIFGKYPMMDGPEFLKLRTEAAVYLTPGTDEANDVNTDWQDLFYRTGMVTSHDLDVTGGTEKGNYRIGAGYYRDEAVVPGQDYTRYALRATVDQEVGKYFRFGFTTNNSYSISKGGNMGIYGVISLSPLANPYNADGSWKRTIKMPADEQWTYSEDIINSLGDKWIDQTRAFASYNSIYGEFKIPYVEGLKYRVNLGLNYRQSNLGQYQGEGVFQTNASTVSQATIGNSHTTSWAIENLMTYDHTFAMKHQVGIVALFSTEQNNYNSSRISAKDIPADAFQFYNLGRAAGEITINPDNQGYSVSGLESYMGRVNYSYDNRYMLMASFRRDGSSRLAPGHKWVSYPAVSVGWNLHNESFMKGITMIDQLKLRAGYGVTSNQAIDPYSTLGLLKTNPMNLGTVNTTSYYVSQLPNPNLGWEITEEMNYAVDFSLLKNRLSGTIEYYQQDTKDLLLSVSLPTTTGVNSYMANVGKSQNKGFEISLNGVILENLNGWTWEVGINLYTNKNELIALASGAREDKNNNWFVGHPINVLYDFKTVGLWNETDPDYQFLKKYEPTGNVGMLKALYTGDYNTDGSPTRVVGDLDKQIISMDPDFQGGFNSRLAYKGFDLTIVGAFKSGGILIATPYGSNGYLNILTGRRGNVKADYWTPTNTGAKYPKPGGVGGDQPKYLNSLSYFDASFLKIRTITLGYNLKQSWLKKIGMDNMRIYVTAQNPFVLFSPYYKESKMDPETNSYGNENAAVTMSYNLRRLLTVGNNTPSTRNFLFGLNFTF